MINIPKICKICGEDSGFGNDHTECSKLLQEMHKDDKKRRAKKKLTKAVIKSYGEYFSKVDK